MSAVRIVKSLSILLILALLAFATGSLCLAENSALAAETSKAPAEPNGKSIVSSLAPVDKGKEKPPILVKADTLTLEAKKRLFTYRGNVEARRGELFITADALVGSYDKNNRIQKIYCEDNVVITREDSLRATSNHAVYNVETSTITLTEAPELLHHGNALTADKVSIFLDEDRTEAEGNVRAKVVKTQDKSAGNGKGLSLGSMLNGKQEEKAGKE